MIGDIVIESKRVRIASSLPFDFVIRKLRKHEARLRMLWGAAADRIPWKQSARLSGVIAARLSTSAPPKLTLPPPDRLVRSIVTPAAAACSGHTARRSAMCSPGELRLFC